MGPEPLEVKIDVLVEKLKRTKRAIKNVLLDQTVLAGIGNIYADEALFESGIHPLARADRLNGEQARRLHAAIKKILRRDQTQRQHVARLCRCRGRQRPIPETPPRLRSRRPALSHLQEANQTHRPRRPLDALLSGNAKRRSRSTKNTKEGELRNAGLDSMAVFLPHAVIRIALNVAELHQCLLWVRCFSGPVIRLFECKK